MTQYYSYTIGFSFILTVDNMFIEMILDYTRQLKLK